MKKTLAMLALCALVAAPAVAQDETVTFTKALPGAGDTRSETGGMSMEMDIEIYAQGNLAQSMKQKKNEENEKKTISILEGEGDKVTKVKVSMTEKSSKQTMSMPGPDGEPQEQVNEKESPLVGKTFILTKGEGGEISVTDGEGNAIEGAEADEARAEAKGAFKGDDSKFSKVLPDRPIKVGETITVSGDKAREIFADDDDGFKDATLTLTLKGTKEHGGRTCGHFDMTMVMSGEPQPGLNLEAELSGELLMDIETSWPCQMDLTGPISMNGKNPQQGIEFKGSGTMTMKAAAEYSTSGE